MGHTAANGTLEVEARLKTKPGSGPNFLLFEEYDVGAHGGFGERHLGTILITRHAPNISPHTMQKRPVHVQRDFESKMDEKTPTATQQTQSHGTFTSILRTLSPYLSSDVVFPSEDRKAIKKQNLTILSVDIRGFTSLGETVDPAECVNILNEYFDFAADVVFEFRGDVDKFQGDGFMAIFKEIEGENHERRAVQCALRLRDIVKSLNLPEIAGARIPLGMGLNTGVAAVGTVGSKTRRDYTVIGDVVNVAHYLQRISGPDQIILSGNTQRRMGVDIDCAPLGYIRVKRRINRVEAFLIQ